MTVPYAAYSCSTIGKHPRWNTASHSTIITLFAFRRMSTNSLWHQHVQTEMRSFEMFGIYSIAKGLKKLFYYFSVQFLQSFCYIITL
jgi:hypothetical protein